MFACAQNHLFGMTAIATALSQSAAQYAEYAKAARAAASARDAPQSHPINVDHPERPAPAVKAPPAPQVAPMKFSAEGRYLNAQLYIADGVLKVPPEVLEVRTPPFAGPQHDRSWELGLRAQLALALV